MLYNLALLIGILFALPKWLSQAKYRGTILERLGFRLPQASTKKPVIWIHMVSMGETKAMSATYQFLKEKCPNGDFYLSSTTKTGHQEAKRSLTGATAYFLLPLDLSWIMKKLTDRIQPTLFILSESDFWPHVLAAIKKRGGEIILLNGKISPTSVSRFSKFPRFAKKTFQNIDHFYLQNEEYARSFASLNIPQEKISITGNLKLTNPLISLSNDEKQSWRRKFNIGPEETVITLGSTHEGEEELLLQHMPKAKILIVPRHPERFSNVKKFIAKTHNPDFIVVDQMGILSTCYQLSDLAIVGGSFLPGVGGHNIFEPIQANIPVIFGPYMETQKELVHLILNANAGIQTPIEDLPKALDAAKNLTENVKNLLLKVQSNQRTVFNQIETHLPCG